MGFLQKWVRAAVLAGGVCGFAVLVAPHLTVEAQQPNREARVKAEAHLSVEKLVPGQDCEILVRLTVQPGWHINSNPPKPMEYVPTEVEFKGKQGTKLSKLKFPDGKPLRVDGEPEPLSVYSGKVDLFGRLSVPAAAAGQVEEMEIVVKFQACNDKTCELPATVKLSGKLPVARQGEAVRSINEKLFAKPNS